MVKIAFDGGAFQQGITGGIFSVAVGLINALTELRDDLSIILVGEARWPQMDAALVNQLWRPPEIIYEAIVPDHQSRHLTTASAEIRFEVDGRIVPARITFEGACYEGPAPQRSFSILSRSVRPSESKPNADGRKLGLSVTGLRLRTEQGTKLLAADDPRLTRGFHRAEGGHRWTNGAASLPVELFEHAERDVELIVRLGDSLDYQIRDIAVNAVFDATKSRLDDIKSNLSVSLLERELIARGAVLNIVNHFIPIQTHLLPSYAILHDMIPVRFPSLFDRDALLNYAKNLSVFRNCLHVFSNSETSRADLIKLGGVDPSAVTAVGLDIDPIYKVRSRSEIENARSAAGVEGPYMLCVGTLEPRKNHARLIAAYERAFRATGFPLQLIIVGKRGWGYGPALAAVERLGLTAHVVFVSDADNAMLAALYSGAEFSAYVSVFEGFGLPVLESMACGCPVVTSMGSSLEEIAGDAALLVDPVDVASISRGLEALWHDRAMRERFRQAGLQRRKRYSWGQTGRAVLNGLHLPAPTRN